MSDPIVKKRTNRLSDSYAAIKSQNEVYYQMASIFKQVTKHETQMTTKILNRLVLGANPEISLENLI